MSGQIPEPLGGHWERLADGQWHHLAIVSDGTSETLYVDGVRS